MTAIFVQNQSTLVSDDDVARMVRSCASQVRMYLAPWWSLQPAPVIYLPHSAVPPPRSWLIGVLDDSDSAGALGWHTEDTGEVIYGRVFARPSLDAGSTALTGTYAVSSVLSHEVCETVVDPHVTSWSQAADGTLYATEVCDPVESFTYTDRALGVELSDFVTPAWFDPAADPRDRFSLLGRVSAPFALGAGGYVVKMPPGGAPQQVFGENMPAWKREQKSGELSRGGRRMR